MREELRVKEMTRRSIAQLISIQRGDETWNKEDYITAGNIMIVVTRYSKENAQSEITRSNLQLLDELEASKEQFVTEDPITEVQSVDDYINIKVIEAKRKELKESS